VETRGEAWPERTGIHGPLSEQFAANVTQVTEATYRDESTVWTGTGKVTLGHGFSELGASKGRKTPREFDGDDR